MIVKFQYFSENSPKMKVFKKHINLILMPLLRELRGYNILYYGYIRYFIVNFFVRDNVTLIYPIPPNVVGVEN